MDRLDNIIICSQAKSYHLFLDCTDRGKENNRSVSKLGFRSHISTYLKTIHAWHHQIEQNQIWVAGQCGWERVTAVIDGDYIISLFRQNQIEQLRCTLVIIDNKNFAHKPFLE